MSPSCSSAAGGVERVQMGVVPLIPGVPFWLAEARQTAPQARILRSFAATTIGRLQTNVTDETVVSLNRFQLAILRTSTWGQAHGDAVFRRPSPIDHQGDTSPDLQGAMSPEPFAEDGQTI